LPIRDYEMLQKIIDLNRGLEYDMLFSASD